MLETIQNPSPPAVAVVNSNGIGPPQPQPASPEQDASMPAAPAKEAGEAPAAAQAQAETTVSESFLKDLETEIESLHHVGLQFAKHDISGKTMIRIVNKETGGTIREIPSEKLLDLAAKLEEMLGILFDKTV